MGFMVSLTDNDGGNFISDPLTELDIYSNFILRNSNLDDHSMYSKKNLLELTLGIVLM